jgi:hypothetical protein
MFQTKVIEKIKHTFFENRTVYEIMWKSIVEWGRPQMTIRRMRISCSIPKATDILKICNAYCFSTPRVGLWTRLNVTSHAHSLSCYCVNSHRSLKGEGRRFIKVNLREPLLAFLVARTVKFLFKALRLQPHQKRSVQFPHHTQTNSNSSTIVAGSSNGLTSTRYCKYSWVCSWWWVEITPEICRAIFQK